MQIEQLQRLLDEIKTLPTHYREKTLFDIGTRGHFENPTTDVLAFFCNVNEEHQLNSLLIDSIITVLLRNNPELSIESSQAFAVPQREVVTDNNKRIDLLISSDKWLMVIENKIFHEQINPFDEYEVFSNNLLKHDEHQGKQQLFVVLSPNGHIDNAEHNPLWVGIAYADLIAEIKNRLNRFFFDHPFNKWILILKDFLLHLDNIVTEQEQEEQHTYFALTHLCEITNAWAILKNSFSEINCKFIAKFDSNSLISKQLMKPREHHWFNDLPTFIYKLENSNVELVLFASADEQHAISDLHNRNINKSLFIQIQINQKNYPDVYQLLSQKLRYKIVDQWQDRFRWPIEDIAPSIVVEELFSTMLVINEVEKAIFNNEDSNKI